MSYEKLRRGDFLGFLNALLFEFSGALLGIVVAGILFGAANGKAAMIAAVAGLSPLRRRNGRGWSSCKRTRLGDAQE